MELKLSGEFIAWTFNISPMPENISVNTLINKGLSVITKEELLNLSILKRNRESLSAMSGI